jgi:hypothetical protein
LADDDLDRHALHDLDEIAGQRILTLFPTKSTANPFNALGGALWVLVWSFAGFYLGKHVSNLEFVANNLEYGGALLGVGVLIVALLYTAWRTRRKS